MAEKILYGDSLGTVIDKINEAIEAFNNTGGGNVDLSNYVDTDNDQYIGGLKTFYAIGVKDEDNGGEGLGVVGKSYTTMYGSKSVKKGGFQYSFPNKSGTFALLSDINGTASGFPIIDCEKLPSVGGDFLDSGLDKVFHRVSKDEIYTLFGGRLGTKNLINEYKVSINIVDSLPNIGTLAKDDENKIITIYAPKNDSKGIMYGYADGNWVPVELLFDAKGLWGGYIGKEELESFDNFYVDPNLVYIVRDTIQKLYFYNRYERYWKEVGDNIQDVDTLPLYPDQIDEQKFYLVYENDKPQLYYYSQKTYSWVNVGGGGAKVYEISSITAQEAYEAAESISNGNNVTLKVVFGDIPCYVKASCALFDGEVFYIASTFYLMGDYLLTVSGTKEEIGVEIKEKPAPVPKYTVQIADAGIRIMYGTYNDFDGSMTGQWNGETSITLTDVTFISILDECKTESTVRVNGGIKIGATLQVGDSVEGVASGDTIVLSSINTNM